MKSQANLKAGGAGAMLAIVGCLAIGMATTAMAKDVKSGTAGLGLPPYEGAAQSHNRSLYEYSAVLTDGTRHTVVPKGGVIFVPPILKDRLADGIPLNDFLKWPEFLRQNARWIALEEISLAQATGKAPLASHRIEAITRSRLLVVAVHRGCPISYHGEPIVGRERKETTRAPAVVAMAAPPAAPRTAALMAPGFPGKAP